MVIVRLYGGLGNQMFQYATGLALTKRLKTKILLDTAWFDDVINHPELTYRTYELDQFRIKPGTFGPLDKISMKLSPPVIFHEKSTSYSCAFQELRGNVILDGYWQSYKYFADYSTAIRRAFKFPFRPKPQNAKVINYIQSVNSVALHVRRGDYKTKQGKEFHGLIPISYYSKAITEISKKINDPHFFIFSDEIDWAKRHLKSSYPLVYIDSNSPNKGSEDMQLMTACKHFVIANSSFSWWAAWLNENPKKIVIAPEKWFANSDVQIGDRIPETWRLL